MDGQTVGCKRRAMDVVFTFLSLSLFLPSSLCFCLTEESSLLHRTPTPNLSIFLNQKSPKSHKPRIPPKKSQCFPQQSLTVKNKSQQNFSKLIAKLTTQSAFPTYLFQGWHHAAPPVHCLALQTTKNIAAAAVLSECSRSSSEWEE